ncbi:hypothetical protein MHU86_7637 [Fragilaria crotonensis]|nr:hypothetical protein MHU86_7637 [Fragilaria crotonensis]
MKQPSLTSFFRPAPPKTVSSEEVLVKSDINDKFVTFPVESSWQKRKVQRKASPSRKRAKPATPKTETDISDDSDESFVVPGSSPSRRQQRACSKKIKYVIDDTDEDDDDMLTKTTAKSKANDDSSDFEGMDDEDSDDELLDAASDDDEIQAPKVNPRAKPRKSTPGKKPAAKPARAVKEGAPEKKKMSESFEAKNYPDYQKLSLQQIKEQKGFLDPCGMEATDGIIDRLVGEQVDKIGGLLQRAIQHDFGSIDTALQLGTACSGTDALALALGLVKEQMELRKMLPLNFTHEFSCEVDPFKQAYLARNFDSILYPDISKLTDDPPRDVYGQEKPIPPFNLFVAGTSCKTFRCYDRISA